MKDKEKPIKPKTSVPQAEAEDIVTEEPQERVTEKLSLSVPTQPLLRPTGLGSFFGKWVRLLLRDGSIVIGLLQKRVYDFVHLLNIVEIGSGYKLTAARCAITIASIARVYPADAKIDEIPKA